MLFSSSYNQGEFIDWRGEKFKWKESIEDSLLKENNIIFDHNHNSFSENIKNLEYYSIDSTNHVKFLK